MVPLQENFISLEIQTEDDIKKLTSGTILHLLAASVFFSLAIIHGALVMIYGLRAWLSGRDDFSAKSLKLKGSALSLVLLAFVLPARVAAPALGVENVSGARQRIVVLAVLVFLATYAVDLRGAEARRRPAGDSPRGRRTELEDLVPQ